MRTSAKIFWVESWLVLFDCFCRYFFFSSAERSKRARLPRIFYDHKPPETNLSVNIICGHHFALGYSEDRTSSLWSAEHLTRTGLLHAAQLPPDRTRFYPDERVPVTSRAQLDDYRQVPFMPAPLVPHEDMPDLASRIESYALTNAIPQDPRFHALSWKSIEDSFRKDVMENEEAYIITGVAYMAALNALGWDQIHVPTHIWKGMYLPRQKKGKAIACRNQIPAECRWLDWDELKNVIGVNPFPGFESTEERDKAENAAEKDLKDAAVAATGVATAETSSASQEVSSAVSAPSPQVVQAE
ncbi:DNA/RNA non-specific endonuclease [Acetobacteraceae bacterium]|nr:DNA/RNA non-specific endonuclease [Acetobacteraceae bacterium]